MSANDTSTRLYIDLPQKALHDLEATRTLLENLSARLDIACINSPVAKIAGDKAFATDPQYRAFINALQQMNIAVLADLTSPDYLENRKSFEKALEKAVDADFDGIHMSADPVLYERAREVLARDAIIGCACGSSRHQAMLLGEAGADYVALASGGPDNEQAGSPVELVEWWQELFEVPCIATNIVDQSHMEALLEIGADFISIGPGLWPRLQGDEKFLSWLAAKCPALAEVD